jgi:hypothetical protein
MPDLANINELLANTQNIVLIEQYLVQIEKSLDL